MDNFRFHLKKGGKEADLAHPMVRKASSFLTLTKNNNIVDAEKYGRCERIHSCGYQEYSVVERQRMDDADSKKVDNHCTYANGVCGERFS